MKVISPSASLAVATLCLALASTLGAQDATGSAQTRTKKGQENPNRAAEMLERFDKNGDGKLDDAERAAAREEMRGAARSRPAARPGSAKGAEIRERMLEQHDTNKDGRIDDEERAAARMAGEERIRKMDPARRAELQNRQGAGGSKGAVRPEVLERFDKDGDGKLNDAERAEMRKAAGDRIAQNPKMLERFDANGDGQLDETERAAAREAMQERMKGGKDDKAGKSPKRGPRKG